MAGINKDISTIMHKHMETKFTQEVWINIMTCTQ